MFKHNYHPSTSANTVNRPALWAELGDPQEMVLGKKSSIDTNQLLPECYAPIAGSACTSIGLKVFSVPDKTWQVFAAASFLVSVPVFVQAPLVRYLPLLSLAMTAGWFWLGCTLLKRTSTKLWGDLLLGFSWSWLAGSIYWGWYRWEPSIHLPIEAIGLPFALWFLWRASREQKSKFALYTPTFGQNFLLKGQVGNLFYLGSLLGTAITDLYFYLTGSIGYWRQLMQVEPAMATLILQSAIAHIRTPWGLAWAVVLANLLLAIALWALQTKQLHWWAFAGAVFSTILVDGLFAVVAFLV